MSADNNQIFTKEIGFILGRKQIQVYRLPSNYGPRKQHIPSTHSKPATETTPEKPTDALLGHSSGKDPELSEQVD